MAFPATARAASLRLVSGAAVLLIPSLAQASQGLAGQRFYFGDFHVHSGASGDGFATDIGHGCAEQDGEVQPCGAVSEIIQVARANSLDFLALTDHVNGEVRATATDFDAALALVMQGHDPASGFLTIPAGEIWVTPSDLVGGHLNLYFLAENSALFDLGRQDFIHAMVDDKPSTTFESCEQLWVWMDQLEQDFGPVLILPHHPQMSDGMATNWVCFGNDQPDARRFTPAVEIYSRHGNSTTLPAPYDPLWRADVEELHDLQAALDPDRWDLRLGLLASTDGHDTLPGDVCNNQGAYIHMPYGGGLAVAVLPESEPWSRASLFEAIHARRTYATSGPMLPVLLDILADGERVGGMGEELVLAAEANIEAILTIPSEHEGAILQAFLRTPHEDIELAHGADGVYRATISRQDRPAWIYAVLRIDGDRWYGEQGCDDGGDDREERIWLSPTWLDLPQTPDSGEDHDTDDEDEDSKVDDSGPGDPAPTGCGGCAGAPSRAALALVPAGLLCAWQRRRRPAIVRSW